MDLNYSLKRFKEEALKEESFDIGEIAIMLVPKLEAKINNLQRTQKQIEADCACMRKALNNWNLLIHFMKSPVDWRTGESLENPLRDCIQSTDKALAIDSDMTLLNKLDQHEQALQLACRELTRERFIGFPKKKQILQYKKQ